MPPWYNTMVSITGVREAYSTADNPVILGWAGEIARRYPEMTDYCKLYTHDSIPWCGLAMAYCMAVNNIRPPFGPTDYDKFLWADAWRRWELALPIAHRRGCLLTFKTSPTSNHVTLMESYSSGFFGWGASYTTRGGNQGDAVTATGKYSKSALTSAFWVKGYPLD